MTNFKFKNKIKKVQLEIKSWTPGKEVNILKKWINYEGDLQHLYINHMKEYESNCDCVYLTFAVDSLVGRNLINTDELSKYCIHTHSQENLWFYGLYKDLQNYADKYMDEVSIWTDSYARTISMGTKDMYIMRILMSYFDKTLDITQIPDVQRALTYNKIVGAYTSPRSKYGLSPMDAINLIDLVRTNYVFSMSDSYMRNARLIKKNIYDFGIDSNVTTDRPLRDDFDWCIQIPKDIEHLTYSDVRQAVSNELDPKINDIHALEVYSTHIHAFIRHCKEIEKEKSKK